MNSKRAMMFGGKGGVGKTTCAGATALHYARSGQKTLLVSTDAAPSLSDIFEIDGSRNKPVEVTQNLFISELGMDEVKDMWDGKFGREVYEIFSVAIDIPYEEFVGFMVSILPGLRDEFMVDYIKDLVRAGAYERVVWDTAPLGETIGLLKMPSMMSEHLKPAARIYSKLKFGQWSKRSVQEVIKGWAELSRENIEFLQNEVDFNIVAIPEALSVFQIDSIRDEFAASGFAISRLIINDVIAPDDGSEFLARKRAEQQEYVQMIQNKKYGWPVVELPLFPYEIKGLGRLEGIGRVLFSA